MQNSMQEVAVMCEDRDMERMDRIRNMKEISNMHDISQKKAVRKITVACIICITFMILEIIAAVWSNSLSLMTDASHLFCDICSFALNLFSIYISNLEGNIDMSFGYHRAEIIGALFSIFFIWALSAYILYSSILRLFHVKIVNGYIMFVTAFVSTLANIFTAFILKVHTHGFDLDHQGCGHNHNQHHHTHQIHSSHSECSSHHSIENAEQFRHRKEYQQTCTLSINHNQASSSDTRMKQEETSSCRKGKNGYTKLKEDLTTFMCSGNDKDDLRWDTNKTSDSTCEYVAFDYYQNMSKNKMEADQLNEPRRICCGYDGEQTNKENRKTNTNTEKMKGRKEKETKQEKETKEGNEVREGKEGIEGIEEKDQTYKNKKEYEAELNLGKEETEDILAAEEQNHKRITQKWKGEKEKSEEKETSSSEQFLQTNIDKNNKYEIEKKTNRRNYKKGKNSEKNERYSETGKEPLCEAEINGNEPKVVEHSYSQKSTCCEKRQHNMVSIQGSNFEEGDHEHYCEKERKRKKKSATNSSYSKNDKNSIFHQDHGPSDHLCPNEKKKNYCCTQTSTMESSNSREIENINLKAAYIHAISDLIQNIGVIFASLIIWFNPQYSVVDPICSIVFCFIVFSTTVSVIKEVLNVLMEGTPEGLNLIELKNDLLNIAGVIDIHDLHVWSLSIGKPALACHIVTHKNNSHDVLKCATSLCQKKYKILHTTVQTDYPSNISNCETYAHLKCSNLKMIT